MRELTRLESGLGQIFIWPEDAPLQREEQMPLFAERAKQYDGNLEPASFDANPEESSLTHARDNELIQDAEGNVTGVCPEALEDIRRERDQI